MRVRVRGKGVKVRGNEGLCVRVIENERRRKMKVRGMCEGK